MLCLRERGGTVWCDWGADTEGSGRRGRSSSRWEQAAAPWGLPAAEARPGARRGHSLLPRHCGWKLSQGWCSLVCFLQKLCGSNYPLSIAFIVVNEFCERFSYYGMRGMWPCLGRDLCIAGLLYTPAWCSGVVLYVVTVVFQSKLVFWDAGMDNVP